MKKLISSVAEKLTLALYSLGFLILIGAHFYTTFIAYQYLFAWKASRALFWIAATLFVPVASTLYWLVVHWLQLEVFWNPLTVAIASGLCCIGAGIVCEVLQHRNSV